MYKACFDGNKIFLIRKPAFDGLLKVIGIQNVLNVGISNSINQFSTAGFWFYYFRCKIVGKNCEF